MQGLSKCFYLIASVLCPVNDYDITNWHRQKRVHRYPEFLGYKILDLISSISTGEDPNRFIVGKNADNLHPNQSGFDDMATAYIGFVTSQLSTQQWIPI